MPVPSDPALISPLSSIEISAGPPAETTSGRMTSPTSARPLPLRGLRVAPEREIPQYSYDTARQVAVDPRGRPLAPSLKKDWTTIEGTHTDGDGGDNEMWDWEEVR